jgi:hypothetical protein
MKLPAAIFLLMLAVSQLVQADSGPTTPPPGSAERKAICDALRVPVMKDFGVKPVFVIQTLVVMDGWAFMAAGLQREDGTAYQAEELYTHGFGRIPVVVTGLHRLDRRAAASDDGHGGIGDGNHARAAHGVSHR